MATTVKPMPWLDRQVAYWTFGWLPSDKLPGVALDALERGIDSPTMIALASADATAEPEHHVLFRKALLELGRSPFSKADAGRIIAQVYAEQICEGKIAPVEGANEIWRVSLECPELTSELGIFGGRVSDYHGLPEGFDRPSDVVIAETRQRISEAIIAEARSLLGRVS